MDSFVTLVIVLHDFCTLNGKNTHENADNLPCGLGKHSTIHRIGRERPGRVCYQATNESQIHTNRSRRVKYQLIISLKVAIGDENYW